MKRNRRDVFMRIWDAEKPDWQHIQPAFDRANLCALCPAVILLLLSCAAGALCHLFVLSDKKPAVVYAAAGVLLLLLLLYLLLRKRDPSPAAVRALVIAVSVLCYAVPVCLDVLCYPKQPAVGAFLMLLAVPLLFDVRPMQSLLTVAPFLAFFLVLDATAKTTPLFVCDTLCGVLICLLGQYLGFAKSLRKSNAAIANERLLAVNYHLYHADAPDPLTGLAGREQAFALLREVYGACTSGDLFCNCIVAEVDAFPAYNTTFGKDAGDRLLAALGAQFARFEEETGVPVCRIGAATFLSAWADITDTRCELLAEQLQKSAAQLAASGDGRDPVTVSIGLYADVPEPNASSTDDAYHLASKALFYAQDQGCGHICRFERENGASSHGGDGYQ